MERYPVGYAGTTIELDRGWRVLDVGSGHNPNPRADVLLEKEIEDHIHRGGAAADAADPRLVVGDAIAMPFLRPADVENAHWPWQIPGQLEEEAPPPAAQPVRERITT